jgi:excisionase family DNA binding protein
MTDESVVTAPVATQSLDAVALQICGPDSGMKDPRGWVLRQIRRGRFQAYKVGRHYRMSQQQIDAALDALKTKPAVSEPARPERPRGLSLTPTSARSLRGAPTRPQTIPSAASAD